MLSRALQFPGALYAALILAAVVALPSLAGGFFADDVAHLSILEGVPGPGSRMELFRFASGDAEHMRPFIERGPYPWWTHPNVKLWFFRPLSSALANVDHALFGRWAPGYHAHSILWYLLFILGAALVFRRTLAGVAGAVALLLFAVDSNHWMPVGWIANRNAVVSAAPALFGLAAHLRWREEGWRPGIALSVLGYAVGLLGGETAIAVMAFAAAYELTGAKGSAQQRLLGLVPAALLGIVYVVVYKLLGYGAWGSGIYIDPTKTPVEYLLAAPGRFLALMGGALLHAPVELWAFAPAMKGVLVAIGVVTGVSAFFAGRQVYRAADEQTRRHVRWLLLGSALSTVPVMATFPANRLLFVPSIGVAVLFALLLLNARGFAKAVMVVFLGAHVFGALLTWPGFPYLVRETARQGVAAIENAEINDAAAADTQYVILNAPDALIGIYHPMVRRMFGHPLPKAWQVMTFAPHDVRVTRSSERSFEFELTNGRMMQTLFEEIVRAESLPLRTDERYPLLGMTVRVAEMDGTAPKRVRVELDAPMEAPRYEFLHWKDGALRRWKLPGVGQSVVLVHERGPAEL